MAGGLTNWKLTYATQKGSGQPGIKNETKTNHLSSHLTKFPEFCYLHMDSGKALSVPPLQRARGPARLVSYTTPAFYWLMGNGTLCLYFSVYRATGNNRHTNRVPGETDDTGADDLETEAKTPPRKGCVSRSYVKGNWERCLRHQNPHLRGQRVKSGTESRAL